MRDGLLVSLDDAPWEEQRAALMSQVDAQPAFFQGARLALDVTSQILRVNEMAELRDQLSERGIFLWALISESPTTEKTAPEAARIGDAHFQAPPGGRSSVCDRGFGK